MGLSAGVLLPRRHRWLQSRAHRRSQVGLHIAGDAAGSGRSRRNSISVSQTSRGSPPGRRGALDALASQLALSLVDALMLGVVIGGSATMIVTSSNLVAAGAARQRGSRLGFCTCLSYGLPSVGLQLLVAWLGCWHAGR